MIPPHAIVLKAPGTNCDIESRDALERAGASASIVTTSELLADPEMLYAARILLFPGGFAHGDDIASARILANQIRTRLGEPIKRFVDEHGGYVVGICNGFQALVKAGLLPRKKGADLKQRVSVVHNDGGSYVCRWVKLRVESSRCTWLPEDMIWEMPVGHGEGKFVPGPDFDTSGDLVALRYIDDSNPNGSVDAVAGICDESGHVLGLMPHPDRSYLGHHHPSSLLHRIEDEDSSGSQFFTALVNAAQLANA